MNDRPKQTETTQNPDPNSIKRNTIRVEPATIVFIIVALLLIPLMITGFLSQ
ncbi:hypothetical protein [Thermocoleostomius sinensis]|jgi:hypothetical protein|uniref:Uncharacterized protein n=1 Tax=Thermocoleostomius sinensis A174 TaxID=2016057 RepID=A0A9E8ZBY6_9CYAN|nr:hypothetical protein [Thermocoleostomius sinensis]WAL60429.1 hypothetical protein OXH18_00095 [Thermocoleostomius sinensis A174]